MPSQDPRNRILVAAKNVAAKNLVEWPPGYLPVRATRSDVRMKGAPMADEDHETGCPYARSAEPKDPARPQCAKNLQFTQEIPEFG